MSDATMIPAILVFLAISAPQDGGVPKDVRGFSGQVTGIVAGRHDDGTFSFQVSRVTRVWKDNEATNIEWFLGRTIRVAPRWTKRDDGQWRAVDRHVRFIRQLRDRDDYRLEIRYAEGDRFAILELSDDQRQLADRDQEARRDDRGQEDRKRSEQLAAGVRGFSGQVGGIVRSMHDDGTVTLEVLKVFQVWKNSKAQKPEALAGTTVRVGPRWVQGDDRKWRPYPLHVAFVRGLDLGEDYRLEIQNVEGDRFQILELSAEQRERARQRTGGERRRDRR